MSDVSQRNEERIQMNNRKLIGHLAALLAVVIWGTTFISSKVLLRSFDPVEILVIRFLIGLAALFIVCPKRLRLTDKKQEIYYILTGLTGVTLYYLLENIALTFTFASNVGVIISTAPFFTAVVLHLFLKDKEPLGGAFFVGFVVALAGIAFISFNGTQFHLSPVGDLLTIGAALCWAFYSMFLKKVNSFGYLTILNTRRIFLWGIVFMVPMGFVMGFRPDVRKIVEPMNLLNFLFLGIVACAVCFVVWNFAVKEIGAIRTSIYIYLSPAITVFASALLLGEPVTGMMLAGTALALIGLLISEIKPGKIRKHRAGHSSFKQDGN